MSEYPDVPAIEDIDDEPVVELGDLVVDKVTGYTGIATDITTWLHGCDRVAVQSRELGKEGKPIDNEVFDILQLNVLEKSVVPLGLDAGVAKTDFKLGDSLIDDITGFKGVAVAQTVFLHFPGRRILLQPQELKDGKPLDTYGFQETQLHLEVKEKVEPDKRKKRTGGPRDERVLRAVGRF